MRLRNVAAALGAVVLAVALLVGAWVGYWRLAQSSTSNRYNVNTHNQQYQAGLIAQERDRVSALAVTTNDAQRRLIESQFCAVYTQLSPPTADLAAAFDTFCSNTEETP